ncbi:unnamed protein product [Caenorhabditis auriculariae]|uniref:Uncharacterized protein n=1 Tax=Caenorhabditis auriculariae TaxID=2777116 RepID=A0A8S1HAU8_9PELO|nr:unnamed protein product [Caenorhabditis auriculariae]
MSPRIMMGLFSRHKSPPTTSFGHASFFDFLSITHGEFVRILFLRIASGFFEDFSKGNQVSEAILEMSSNLVPPQVVVDTPRPQHPADGAVQADCKGLISISLSNFVRPSRVPQGKRPQIAFKVASSQPTSKSEAQEKVSRSIPAFAFPTADFNV